MNLTDFNTKTHHPLLYSLRKVDWSLYGTLTWQDSLHRSDTDRAQQLRTADFYNLLIKARAATNLRGKDLAYYHATEYGMDNKCHLHFLLWNKRAGRVANDTLASKMQEVWNTQFVLARRSSDIERGAVVKVYDSTCHSPAVEYCTKREFDAKGYERERYDTPSDNLLRHLMWLAN